MREEEEHLCRLSRDDKKGDFVNDDDDDDVDMLERKKISTVLKKCRFRSATNNTFLSHFYHFYHIFTNPEKKKKKEKKIKKGL